MQPFVSLEEACWAINVQPLPMNRLRPGRWTPTSTLDGRRRNDAGRILLFADMRGGMVHNWRTDMHTLFFFDGMKRRTKEEMRKLRKEAEEAREKAMAYTREVQRSRAIIARDALKELGQLCAQRNDMHTSIPPMSSYLEKKEIGYQQEVYCDEFDIIRHVGYHPKGNNGMFLSGVIVVLPIVDLFFDYAQVRSLQFIDGKGSKAMLRGGAVKGNCITMLSHEALAQINQEYGRLGVAEGYATARSVEELFVHPCVAALSCGNLAAVAKKIHKNFPRIELVLYSDTGSGNIYAMRAADEVSGVVKCPHFNTQEFRKFEEEHGHAPTDWNDWGIMHKWRRDDLER